MNSSTSRYAEKKQTQEEIKKQIALLQACLEPEPEPQTGTLVTKSPKRKAIGPVTLAPATPSPKKKRKLEHNSTARPLPRPVFQTAPQQNASRSTGGDAKATSDLYFKPPPSKLLSKLAKISSINVGPTTTEPLPRSTGFAEKPKEIEPLQEERYPSPKRDDRLALINDLEPGPYEHSPPFDDPKFDKLEPHSGINLTSRSILHEDFADYLRGRFYLSPSRLYSTIRLLPDKQGYDVPVPGDWITVAVVAERGPIKFTRAPVAIEAEDGDNKGRKQKGKSSVNESEKSFGKKYVNLKLIDFGARSSSSTGGSSVIRGDAFLTLLLFESDGFDLIPGENGMKPQKLYKGGSRGAFENLTNVKEGDVIALLNPKILKPFQRSSDKPHPVDNVLALTPESTSCIMVIGRSRDLGMCTVRKQDGKVCGSWCDKRVSEICDYHVQNAVQRRRAARPEFSVGTSGMSTSSSSSSMHKRKAAYDPQRQWGLKPEDGSIGDGARYVVSGHVVSGTSSDPRTMYLSENIGRDGQAKAKRKMGSGRDTADRALRALLERDKEGMRTVMKAREAGKVLVKLEKERKGSNKCEQGKKDSKGKRKQLVDDTEEEESDDACGGEKKRQTSYSAGVIRSLGFDPSIKMGQRRPDNTNSQSKLELLEAVRTSRKDIALGPRPGPKIRSGVMASKRDETSIRQSDNEQLKDSNNAGDEMPDKLLMSPAVDKMIDLDDF